MYAEIRAAVCDLPAAVASETAEPLGAYAHGALLRYLFLSSDGVRCITSVADAAVPSLSMRIPLYDWHEREMRQMQGIVFDEHLDPRPLFIQDGRIPEAFTAEGKGVNVVVVGPVHAGVIEPGRFTFSTGGETTVHLDAQLSYSHRGIERAMEGRDALASAALVARICGSCSVSRSWAYARALESLSGAICDEPTEYARVVLAELERLYNHLFDLASAASGAGYGRGLARGLELKERVARLCAVHGRHRLLFDAVVPGGVRTGILADAGALRASLRDLRAEINRFTKELFENSSVIERFKGTGMLDAQTARLFGTSGPTRRASASSLDLRHLAPYGAYDGLQVRTATSSDGDVLARCSVKRDEIAESLRILDQSLALLDGVGLPAPRAFDVPRGRITTAVEGPRGIETISLETGECGIVDRLHVISASYRNWPAAVRSMEGNIIPDFPLVNKSYNLCYSCVDR